MACCLLPAACCLLPAAWLPGFLVACCLLPAACCLLPAACCLLPAAWLPGCLLPAACCLLPAACCLLPAACYLLTNSLKKKRFVKKSRHLYVKKSEKNGLFMQNEKIVFFSGIRIKDLKIKAKILGSKKMKK